MLQTSEFVDEEENKVASEVVKGVKEIVTNKTNIRRDKNTSEAKKVEHKVAKFKPVPI